ncbi:hypothetical protein BL250_17260 [Erwinia sp. OLTSP20]|uniref:hypothetical protein n=1 Tax=unclassified Erwinia TaxID=2622719 RepID=UPI000C1A8955|nr:MULTISPECIES: hypothetical protein [unclassified Erwinia]PIJ49149.1 hypothetical protein BV501_13905 [Erwinia sp. OAMSP11]PIJ70461.1 hypothetical protein BK416_13465 [Erwinia sp. OLSSP12]PIJ79954.1 hypothetical protein BLD47_12400 [Erwinia sp. OLCASP19]PIJ81316.1 hypothetical protein BLD46_12855 [Erwinia sp. OLMTSP26]PIJ83869.1 hypothetical protein BLD49_12735 [Erwinia sp. OLMDSP33]
MKALRLALGPLVFLSGCATIAGNGSQNVTINTQPPGAHFVVQDEAGRIVARGVTPETVLLVKSDGSYFGKKTYQVMLERPGYVPQTLPLNERVNLWYVLGNIPLGGIPGWLLVDPFYGGMYTIEPALLQSSLSPVGARG